MSDSVPTPEVETVSLAGGPMSVSGTGFEAATLKDGERAFSNRSYAWRGVPERLRGWTCTRLDGGGPAQIKVTASADADLHVATAPSQPGPDLRGWQPVDGWTFNYDDHPTAERAGLPTLVTTVCTARQAAMFAAAGASYLCPYFSRLNDAGGDTAGLIRAVSQRFRRDGVPTRLFPASVRSAEHGRGGVARRRRGRHRLLGRVPRPARRPDDARVARRVRAGRLAAHPPRERLAQKAYEHIQHDILCGALRAGSVISEAAAAKQLGISRTPVGEAIRQLAMDGLVRQVPRYGTIVRAVSPRELSEQYEMREAIESYAAAKAATRIRPDVLARLRGHCAAMDHVARRLRESGRAELSTELLRQFLASDLAFHVLIIEAAGNRRMLNAVQDMRAISRIIGVSRVAHDGDVVDGACADHARIVDALAGGNAEETRLLRAAHIQPSRKRAVARLEQAAEDERLPEVPPELLDDLDQIERPGHITDEPGAPEGDPRGGGGARGAR